MAASNAPLCCGVFSLLVGVELICLVNLLVAIFIIAATSSVMPITLGNIIVSPNAQVMTAAWAAIGIPLIVGAGVGIIYRIEVFLRAYFWYLTATIAAEGLFFVKFLIGGSVCSTFAPRDLERLGTTFVCGITDTFALFWGLIVIGLSAYFLYIIWSAQNDVKRGYWPELMKYRDAWSISPDVPVVPAPVVGSQMGSQLPSSWKPSGMNTLVGSGMMGPVRTIPGPAYGSVPARTRSVSPPSSPDPRYSVSAVPAAAYASMPLGSPRGTGFLPSPASWTPVTTSRLG